MRKSCMMTFAVVGFLAFVSPTTQALDEPMGGAVLLSNLQALSIQNVARVNFGELTIPTNDPALWTIDATSGLLFGSGGNSFDPIAFDHVRGAFEIVGQAGMQAFFDVAVTTDFAGPDLTLTNLTMSLSSPQTLSSIPLLIQVGAELIISPFATPGLHEDAVITISVNY